MVNKTIFALSANVAAKAAVFATVLFCISSYQLFAAGNAEKSRGITLAAATGTYDSGLLDYILPVFASDTGRPIDVIPAETGAVLQMGRNGQADVLLVNAEAQELSFMAEGHGINRFEVMYSDFIIVGPPDLIGQSRDVAAVFKEIAGRNLPFVSCGDESGAHIIEKSIWQNAGGDSTAFSGYVSAGRGMSETLRLAAEKKAFTLTDRATWLSQEPQNLSVICEPDPALPNRYSVIGVDPAKSRRINYEGGLAFINWILSPKAQELIAGFGSLEFGQPLFTPNGRPLVSGRDIPEDRQPVIAARP